MATSRLNDLPVGWWWISAVAGLLAGVAMGLVWSVGSAIRGLGPWVPWNAIGALPPVDTAFTGHSVMGMILHLMVSASLGVIAGAVALLFIPRMVRSWPRALLVGLTFGAFAYLVMGALIGPALSPGITAIIPFVYVLGHLVYGAVVGLAIWALLRTPVMSVSWGPEAPEMASSRRDPDRTFHR